MEFENTKEQEIINEGNELPEKIARVLCPQGPITLDNEAEHVMFTNFLQMALANRKYGETVDSVSFEIWENSYSKKFRVTFEEIIKKNPLFFDGFTNLGDIPEEKWEYFESMLYAE